jgi:hypothetical protein
LNDITDGSNFRIGILGEMAFQAVLHGKLDETIPEPQRREDALTSTIFGTLMMVDARHLLAEWISSAIGIDRSPLGRITAESQFDCWFWPRLREAEPDLLMRMDDRLFVIEAKFGAGKHDLSISVDGGDDQRVTDQLRREWLAVQRDRASESGYPPAIRAAIAKCQTTLLYVVNRRASHRAWKDLRESAKGLPPDADLRILAWQELYCLLNCRSMDRWMTDLVRYIEMVELDAFVGFGRRPLDATTGRQLLIWRSGSISRDVSRLREALWPVVKEEKSVRRLSQWRWNGREPATAGSGLRSSVARYPFAMLSMVQDWRPPDTHPDDDASGLRDAMRLTLGADIHRLKQRVIHYRRNEQRA